MLTYFRQGRFMEFWIISDTFKYQIHYRRNVIKFILDKGYILL
jgi:hypothetical protein